MKTSNLKSTIAAMFTIAVLTACSNNNQQAETPVAENHAHHEATKNDNDSQSQTPKIKHEILDALYPHYQSLQQALVKEDLSQAKKAALLIEEGAKKLSEKEKIIQGAATNVIEATSIAAQREAFASLSEAYIASVKANGMENGTLYIAHCPMAFDNKGADWLSAGKSLENPYFGKKMLSCGTVEETLTTY